MNWLLIFASLVVGTWNGNWFPSGRAEHRAHPEVEAATIAASARMLAAGLQAIDPDGRHDVILCLNEMRGPKVASNLVAQIGRPGLRVVAISGYRRRDRFDMQQDVIATTLPATATGWRKFRPAGEETPPRGYAFAAIEVEPALTAAVYAVHLKSNYGGRSPAAAALNRRKRTRAIAEILADEAERSPRLPCALIVGDLNADRWRAEFAEEQMFGMMERAGFINLLLLLPPKGRGTHPSRTYGDSALDYVMARNFDSAALPQIIPNDSLSDHRALFTLLEPTKGNQR